MAAPAEPRPPGPRPIEGYGPGRFKIAGAVHTGPILVLPDGVHAWPIVDLASATGDSLAALLAVVPLPEILLVGCGTHAALLPAALRAALRSAQVRADAMDTGAACRTFNVLLAEDRRVAAALIPLPPQ